MKEFNSDLNVMVDIETLGNNKNAPIVSISAVRCNLVTGQTFDEFEVFIDFDDAIKHGEASGSTVLWWMQQDDEARAQFKRNDTVKLRDALFKFQQWCYSLESKKSIFTRYWPAPERTNLKIWGNGSGFDLGCLSHAFRKVDLKAPWAFWNERDVRTIVAFIPKMKKIEFTGIKHNGIDDAKHQITYCSNIIKEIWRCLPSTRFDDSVIYRLYDMKAESNNQIDLQAYENGLRDMLNFIQHGK